MTPKPDAKKDLAGYINITQIFKENPELEQKCEQVRNALVRFSKNHTPEQLERFIEAWGKFDIRSLGKILVVPEIYLHEFFKILLDKVFS